MLSRIINYVFIRVFGILDKIDYIDVGTSIATSIITKYMGWKGIVLTNTGVSAGNTIRKVESPYYEGGLSLVLSGLGYKLGKTTENILNQKFNPIWKEYAFKEQYIPYQIFTPYEKSIIPSVSGNFIDNLFSGSTKMEIDKKYKGENKVEK